jgi:beta-glucosidase/6-phospho-beta-glucosidase/beta-galactosidase
MMRLKDFCQRFETTCNKALDGIIVTENGIGESYPDDPLASSIRPRFIIDHLHHLHRAITDGADVRGYLHWSLIDNFELNEGYKYCFGLIQVDCTGEIDPLKSRNWKTAAKLYRNIIKKNGLTNDVMKYVRK